MFREENERKMFEAEQRRVREADMESELSSEKSYRRDPFDLHEHQHHHHEHEQHQHEREYQHQYDLDRGTGGDGHIPRPVLDADSRH